MIKSLVVSLLRRLNTFYLKSILGSCGKSSCFDLGVHIYNPRYITVGDSCTINQGVIIQSCESEKIFIGNHVTLSYRCMILTGGLELSSKLGEKSHTTKRIIIQDGVWIGANSIILPGVKLARGCIVAAGSVVTKDVSEDTIVAGNPAKFIRFK